MVTFPLLAMLVEYAAYFELICTFLPLTAPTSYFFCANGDQTRSKTRTKEIKMQSTPITGNRLLEPQRICDWNFMLPLKNSKCLVLEIEKSNYRNIQTTLAHCRLHIADILPLHPCINKFHCFATFRDRIL